MNYLHSSSLREYAHAILAKTYHQSFFTALQNLERYEREENLTRKITARKSKSPAWGRADRLR